MPNSKNVYSLLMENCLVIMMLTLKIFDTTFWHIHVFLILVNTSLASNVAQRDELIIKYFSEGYTYKEIIAFLLLSHGITLSLRHLKRILVNHSLKRKKIVESPIEEIIRAVLREISSSGKCLGYKTLWRRLKLTYNFNVKRETVFNLVRIMDPDGVNARRKRRFQRRMYRVPGPNFLWHIDGYDKLKPFGFTIHGAIDGYSRRILWLEVATTNNNPRVVARHYLNTVKSIKIVPTLVRTDLGTENTNICRLQTLFRYFHKDALSREKSCIQGKSTSNQKIECWWSQMRRLGGNWWINYFKDLRDQGLYNDADPLHTELLRFCYGGLLQYEMQTIMKEWNQHKIRKQKQAEVPAGKPNVLYHLPELYGSEDYGKGIAPDIVDICMNLYTEPPELHSAMFGDLINILLPAVEYPKNVTEAFNLFVNIKQVLDLYDESDVAIVGDDLLE